jgi:hypothetical protein
MTTIYLQLQNSFTTIGDDYTFPNTFLTDVTQTFGGHTYTVYASGTAHITFSHYNFSTRQFITSVGDEQYPQHIIPENPGFFTQVDGGYGPPRTYLLIDAKIIASSFDPSVLSQQAPRITYTATWRDPYDFDFHVGNDTYTVTIPSFQWVRVDFVGLQIDPTDKSEATALQLAENSSGSITSAPQSGSIHFTDAGTSTRPFASIPPGGQIVSVKDAFGADITAHLTAAQISALKASFTIAAAPGNTNNGAINWTYNPQGSALNFLLEGETAVVTSTVKVSDQDGNSDTATVGITLRGAPDKLHFDVFLGSEGYGTIKAFNNGQPLPLSDTGSYQANIAFDDLMPVPAGTYNVLYRDSPNPNLGEVLAFSLSTGTSEFPDRDAIEIHIGNTPGDSAGCIVTGNANVQGVPTNNYWNGLLNVLNSIVNTENASPNGLGYYTFQNPITVTVSGDTNQPTLLCIPETTALAKGSSEQLDFQVVGLRPSSPIIDKDINVYFQVLGTPATASLIPDAQFEALWPSPTGVLYHNVFTKIIHGSNQQTTNGNSDIKVTLDTSGVASKNLSIQIVGYDGITYKTNGTTDGYAPPGGSIHVQPLLDNSIPVSIDLFSSKPAGTTANAIMRDGTTGNYEIYNIGKNAILAGYLLGQVGTSWQFVGLGGFNNTGQSGNAGLAGVANTTDMVLRDSTSGAFEVYNISDNNIIGAASLGAVGLNWQFGGFGGFSSRPGETDMILRNSGNGALEVYNIANNALMSAYSMGAVGLDWRIAGFGDFSSQPNETDMIMRNSNTGSLEVYNIANNALISAYSMGAVGLDWQVAGFGNFSSHANETDMIMRNSNTGALEVYNIANNSLISAYSMGAVGLDWQVVGFGNFSGNANETDMILQNHNTGALEVYDIANNALLSAYPMGAVGLNWQIGGIAADSPTGSAASADDSAEVPQLVQAMAGFGDSEGAGSTFTVGTDTPQPLMLTTPQFA